MRIFTYTPLARPKAIPMQIAFSIFSSPDSRQPFTGLRACELNGCMMNTGPVSSLLPWMTTYTAGGCRQVYAQTFREIIRFRSEFGKGVNTTLEIGLRNLHKDRNRQNFRLTTDAMGKPQGIPLDKALQIAAALEDDETVRKLEARK